MAITVLTTSTGEALTTPAAVKAHLGIVGSSEDTDLGTLVTRASAAIGRHLHRSIFRQTYRETLPGYGDILIQLAHTPIRKVTSITLRGESITDFVIEDAEAGWLYREKGWEWTRSVNWSLSERIVSGGELPLFTVTYEAGWLSAASASSESRTVPDDLEHAAIETVKAWRAARMRDPEVVRRRLGPLEVEYRGADRLAQGVEALPATARALCRSYRRSPVLA